MCLVISLIFNSDLSLRFQRGLLINCVQNIPIERCVRFRWIFRFAFRYRYIWFHILYYLVHLHLSGQRLINCKNCISINVRWWTKERWKSTFVSCVTLIREYCTRYCIIFSLHISVAKFFIQMRLFRRYFRLLYIKMRIIFHGSECLKIRYMDSLISYNCISISIHIETGINIYTLFLKKSNFLNIF